MPFYPVKINKRFLAPTSAGKLDNASGEATQASFVCGAVLQISLKIENGRILAAKFKAAGCGFLFAGADILCEKVAGKSVNENFDVFNLIAAELGEFEISRQHCVKLVWQTWQAAINNSQAVQASVWNGDEALICTCFGVAERTIENAIENNLLTSVDAVTDVCRAGGGCGSCQPLIQAILDDFWRGAL